MLRDVTDSNPPIDERHIAGFEVDCGFSFPESFTSFLLKTNGGRPVPSVFPIEDFPNNPDDEVQAFFGLNATIPSEDLAAIMADLRGLIPSQILPIACTGCGDFVCIDLRNPNGPVVFWDRKPFWGENIWDEDDLYFVAPSFDSFLDSLHDG